MLLKQRIQTSAEWAPARRMPPKGEGAKPFHQFGPSCIHPSPIPTLVSPLRPEFPGTAQEHGATAGNGGDTIQGDLTNCRHALDDPTQLRHQADESPCIQRVGSGAGEGKESETASEALDGEQRRMKAGPLQWPRWLPRCSCFKQAALHKCYLIVSLLLPLL